LAANIPPVHKGKILGQLEDLKIANLVDIFHTGWYHQDQPSRRWKDESLLVKKVNPRRPVILIAIVPHTIEEALCDYGVSVNIMPKVIYEKIHGDLLLYITMCLQLID
jgi:hypothetical protein